MQKDIQKFKALNCDIKVISFASEKSLAPYKKQLKWDVEIICDPTRKLYKEYGLKRGSIFKILHPKTILGHVGYFVKGKRMKRPTEDVYQLGGDFILDAKGKVCFSYRSKHPDDRPSVKLLLKALRKLS